MRGIKRFRRVFKGTLSLQIMLVDENKGRIPEFVQLVKEIGPDVVHLNTPLRPSSVKPVSRAEMRTAKALFKGIRAVSVYERKKRAVRPISRTDTAKRRRMKGR